MIVGGGLLDEGFHLGKGVRWNNVYRLKMCREVGMGSECRKIQDQEDEAVFASIIGERECGETTGDGGVSIDYVSCLRAASHLYLCKASCSTASDILVWACVRRSVSVLRSS